MLQRVNEISKEKVITTSTNIKKLDQAKQAIINDYYRKSAFVNEMTTDEYTDFIYLRHLVMTADDRKRDIKNGKIGKMR